MAIRQTYRGDPEVKQYTLFDNFSGGVNSTYADEALQSNEYRDLTNVEIDQRGHIRNRKGFQEMALFNELLYQKNLEIPDGKISLFKVISDNYNLFEKFTQYETLPEFVNSTASLSPYLAILILVNNVLYLFKYDNTAGILVVEDVGGWDYRNLSVTLTTLKTFDFRSDSINAHIVGDTPFASDWLSLTKVGEPLSPVIGKYYHVLTDGEYLGKTYLYYSNSYVFSIAEVSEDLKGIVEYDIAAETVRIINKDTAYEPTPYEISGVNGLTGFNVLRENPLLDIADQKVALPSIIGIFLTSTSGVPLTKIGTPTGDIAPSFIVNVIKTGGNNFTYHQVQLIFRDPGGNELPYELDAIETSPATVYGKDNGAYFSYKVKNLEVGTNDFITIDVVYKDFYVNKALAFLTNIGGSSWLGITNGTYVGVREKNFLYKKVVDNKLHTIEDFEKFYPVVTKDVLSVLSDNPETTFVDYMTSDYNGMLFVSRGLDSFNLYQYLHDTAEFDPWQVNSRYYENEEEFTVRVGQLFNVDKFLVVPPGTPIPDNNYYYIVKINGTSTVCVTLSELPSVEYAIPNLLGQYYEIGESETEPIKPVDLDGVKIYGTTDRLIYYKGNTLWYSELSQFDYLPNLNFILLPLTSDDEIVSINYFRGSHIVFTKEKIFRISGRFETENYQVANINEMIGCIAPQSIRNINNSLVFLSKNGLYTLVATYYTDGLETIKRIDTKISNKLVIDEESFAVLRGDQYWLFSPNSTSYDVLRYYFDVELGRGERPFSFDKLAKKPNVIFSTLSGVYAIDESLVFYNEGYTDFMPLDVLEADIPNYEYLVRIETPDLNLGYATHDKKFKSIYVKTDCEMLTKLGVYVYADKRLVLEPTMFNVYVNEDEEVVYNSIENPDAVLDVNPDKLGVGGEFIVDEGYLGGTFYQVHKIIVAQKAKNIKLVLEYSSNHLINVSSIGFLFKLGKVRETR